MKAASIGIPGRGDGPTAIYVTTKIFPRRLVGGALLLAALAALAALGWYSCSAGGEAQ